MGANHDDSTQPYVVSELSVHPLKPDQVAYRHKCNKSEGGDAFRGFPEPSRERYAAHGITQMHSAGYDLLYFSFGL